MEVVEVVQCEWRHGWKLRGERCVRGEQSHNPLVAEAVTGVVGFHESEGMPRFDGAVVLSKKHRGSAYSVGMMKVQLEEEAGAVVGQPY